MHARSIIGAILTPLALVIFGLPAQAIRGESLSTQLPDSSRVTVIKLAYGKKFEIAEEDFSRQAAAGILPPNLSTGLGLKVQTCTNATDTIFVAIVNTFASGTFYVGPARTLNFSTYMGISDDAGNAYTIGYPVRHTGNGSNAVIEVFAAPFVSHTATNITLYFSRNYWTEGFTNYHSSIAAQNPAPHRKSRWTPSPLPVTNQLDEFSVVFSGIQRVGWGIRQLCIPQIQVLEHGIVSTNWRMNEYTAEDEDGNKVYGFWHDFRPREAMKFRLELVNTSPAGSNKILTLHDIRVTNRFVEFITFADRTMTDPPVKR